MKSMTLTDALQVLSDTKLPMIAGGTDFYPALGDSAPPSSVLDLSLIDELRGIERTEDGWRMGALTTWTDVQHASLPPAFDGLKSAAREVGSIQIQNAGTLGGNLCNASPAADGVPALLTLNASVELASVRGTRRLTLDEFILGVRRTDLSADELLVAIHVPHVDDTVRSRFTKLGARRYLVISMVMASITLVPDPRGYLRDVRMAVGACSPVAQRLRGVEDLLRGQSIHDDLVSLLSPELLTELRPIDDVRSSAHYRLIAAHTLLCRMLVSCLQDLPVIRHPSRQDRGLDS